MSKIVVFLVDLGASLVEVYGGDIFAPGGLACLIIRSVQAWATRYNVWMYTIVLNLLCRTMIVCRMSKIDLH